MKSFARRWEIAHSSNGSSQHICNFRLLICYYLSLKALLFTWSNWCGWWYSRCTRTSQGWTVAQAAPIGLLAVVPWLEPLKAYLKRLCAIALDSNYWYANGPYWNLNIHSPIWLMLMFSLVMFTVGSSVTESQISITRRVRSIQAIYLEF